MKNDLWKKRLGPDEYHVLREKGTEPAFTGEYVENKRRGVYACKACGHALFTSEDKYDSGTGWPSFTDTASTESVNTETDYSHGMERAEVLCSKCGGHLGHVFDDGPKPTGKRYCINSIALEFKEKE
ncbi:MAG: peptide-methionine (R)-S-oxide reductase MsrB [Candidatus Altiarchaeota archaeon]